MIDYFPFIHEEKKKEWEPEPLYIEWELPLQPPQEEILENDPIAIIIRLF